MVADTQGAAKELQMAIEKLLEAYGPGRRMDELLRKAEEHGLELRGKDRIKLTSQDKVRPGEPS